ncbi:MAG: hypothetical protein FWE16_00535 [Firmicutes bacterium]|nr:hypothetical protein [Bacillota bacterium]
MKKHLRKLAIFALLLVFALTPFIFSIGKSETRNVLANTRNLVIDSNCIDCECIECFCKDCCVNDNNIIRGGYHIDDIRQIVGVQSYMQLQPREIVRMHTIDGYIKTYENALSLDVVESRSNLYRCT